MTSSVSKRPPLQDITVATISDMEKTAPDHLLNAPQQQNTSEYRVQRPTRETSTYDPLPPLRDAFVLRERSYKQQFANIYYVRLLHLRPPVLEAAEKKWVAGLDTSSRKPKYVDKLLDVKSGEICYVIGTVYMDMPLKPNILDDVTKEHYIAAPPPRPKYVSPDDVVTLEDESGRLRLIGSKLKEGIFVSGIIIAVLGAETPSGDFEVIDYCLPNMAPQSALRTPVINDPTPPKFVALVSGLTIGGRKPLSASIELLTEYLTGELGSYQEQDFSSKIVRVILAGNSLAVPKIVEDDKKPKRYGYDNTTFDGEPVKQLDGILERICSTVTSVDFMPGESDPANVTLPQQAIHFSMFPKACRYSSFQSVTNPYWIQEDGVTFLGTSGQTISDIYKYIEEGDRLQLAASTLRWRHMAPTAPDTLWCYPFPDKDPFIIAETPHVYFIGNQPEYATTIVEGETGQKVRVVLLPSFEKTGTVILVNLTTLECHPIKFDTEFDE